MTTRIIAIIICSVLILTLCPCAYSRSDLQCGDELRIETHDGAMFQGTLRHNDGDSLALRYGWSGLHTIALSDVRTAFRVNRKGRTGFLIGAAAGAGLGFAAALAWYSSLSEDERNGDEIIFIGLSVGGGLAGGLAGWLIGRTTQRLGEVQLEALPTCLSPSGDTLPIKVRYVINF